MPTNRHYRTRRHRGATILDDMLTEALLFGRDWGGHLFGFLQPDFERWASVWKFHRRTLLAAWIAEHPGTRPWSWWLAEAPAPRRVRRGANVPAHLVDDLIAPPDWRTHEAWSHGASCIAHLLPFFEDELEYLRRHKLLAKGEAQAAAKAARAEAKSEAA